MKLQSPLEGDEVTSTSSQVGCVFGWLLGGLLFLPIWAVVNNAFGTALDGPIGAFVMESPCQRLARTTEPLSRYTLGKRKSSSVCHFASETIHVTGATDGLGFTGHEFVYIVIGLVGYAVCFVGAALLAVFLALTGSRLCSRVLRRAGRRRREPTRPKLPRRSKAPTRSRASGRSKR